MKAKQLIVVTYDVDLHPFSVERLENYVMLIVCNIRKEKPSPR